MVRALTLHASATLEEAGLVDVQPLAPQRLYELRGAPFRELHGWLERYRRSWEKRFERSKLSSNESNPPTSMFA